jgi:hypothetical protein
MHRAGVALVFSPILRLDVGEVLSRAVRYKAVRDILEIFAVRQRVHELTAADVESVPGRYCAGMVTKGSRSGVPVSASVKK